MEFPCARQLRSKSTGILRWASRDLWACLILVGIGTFLEANWVLQAVAQESPPTEGSRIAEEYFESKIRPLFIKHCLECHSQESKKTSGGLALDSRDGWMKGGDSGQAIVPQDPAASLVLLAVQHAEGYSPMPPAEHADPLTPNEIEDLRNWIAQGAFDPRVAQQRLGGLTREEAAAWWSLQPIRPIAIAEGVSKFADSESAMNDPIDAFITEKRNQAGVVANRTASRARWLRRVTLDLTGLPPTPDDLDAFEADDSELAYEKVVDRLLASPTHGERYARHWLDVARYADTAGDGADYPVPEAVGYRDWVVRAFQSNMAWDQFITEQIAGDILAEQLANSQKNTDDPRTHSDKSIDLQRYADMVTATGFLAVGKRYGYAPNPDFQHLDFADAIDSLGRSLLGLSLGCARCHDHKYDPVSMEDYYALYGIMQSTRWAFPGGEEQKRPAHFPPLIPREQAARRDKEKADAIAAIDAPLAIAESNQFALDPAFFAGGIDTDFEAQETSKPPKDAWLSAGPNEVTADAQSPYQHVFGTGTRGVRVGEGTPYEGVRYVFKRALRIREDQPLHFTLDFRFPIQQEGEVPDGSFRLYLGRGVIESIAVECGITSRQFSMKENGKWRELQSLIPGEWYHLQLKLDRATQTITGTLGHGASYVSLPPVALPANWDGVADTFISDGFGPVEGKVSRRDLDNLGLDLAPFPAIDSPPAKRERRETEGEQAEFAELRRKHEEKIKQLQADKARLLTEKSYSVAYGVSEGTPTDAKLQLRGEPDKVAHAVARRNLSVLGAEPIREPSTASGRLDLARWLTNADNPLVARVWVNRVWQWHFGKGLVATPSDFGVRGEQPSHPALLDYLAKEFINSGWDVQRLHRSMVLSHTYRLESDSGLDKNGEQDRLWWRMPKRPLDAESIRDSMLQVSGLLDQTHPKPHPFPNVETWGFTIHNPFYAVYDSNHRSLYLMQQRNRRHPYLGLFDGADPNQSVAERFTTTTPTQTLYLMNAPFVHRCAENFARRILAEATSIQDRIVLAYRLTTAERPSSAQVARAEQFLQTYVAARDQEIDSQVAHQGSSEVSLQELQRWGALCRVLISSNRFLSLE